MDKATFEQSPTESNRSWAGMAFLAAGFLLVLWAWGSWIYRASSITVVSSRTHILENNTGLSPEVPAAPDRTGVARALPLFLMFGFVLVIVFFVGSYVLVRTIRRYRAGLARKRSPPTDARDVWSMHTLPEDSKDEE